MEKTQKEVNLIEKYQNHKKDTGSVDVQIALITQRINDLVTHLGDHAKDSDSRRGLLIMVGKRRKLLNYLKKSNVKGYEKIIKDMGLRK